MNQDFDPNVDYYKVLGVSKTQGENELKKAYYKLAQKYHPDKNEGKTSEKFKDITNAYSILSDGSKKQQYDDARKYGGAQSPQGGGQASGPFAGQTGSQQQKYNKQGSFYGSEKWNDQQGRQETHYTYRDKNGNEYHRHTYGAQQNREAQKEAERRAKEFFMEFERRQKEHYEHQRQADREYEQRMTEDPMEAWRRRFRQKPPNQFGEPFTLGDVLKRWARIMLFTYAIVVFFRISKSRASQREQELHQYMHQQNIMEQQAGRNNADMYTQMQNQGTYPPPAFRNNPDYRQQTLAQNGNAYYQNSYFGNKNPNPTGYPNPDDQPGYPPVGGFPRNGGRQ